MLLGLAVTVLAAQPSLASEDPKERLEAVAAREKKVKAPQLSADAARALKDCVVLSPVEETGCARPARLCRLDEGDVAGSASVELVSLEWVDAEGPVKPVRVWRWAGYEPRLASCDPPDPLDSTPTKEERAKAVAAYRKGNARAWQKCLERMRRYAKEDAEEQACDVVLFNPCRKEAYLRCRGHNLQQHQEGLHLLPLSLSP